MTSHYNELLDDVHYSWGEIYLVMWLLLEVRVCLEFGDGAERHHFLLHADHTSRIRSVRKHTACDTRANRSSSSLPSHLFWLIHLTHSFKCIWNEAFINQEHFSIVTVIQKALINIIRVHSEVIHQKELTLFYCLQLKLVWACDWL